MKVKTDELNGPALNWAVALCEGATEEWRDSAPFFWTGSPCIRIDGHDVDYHPSENWLHGGHILEREKIQLSGGKAVRPEHLEVWAAAIIDGEPLKKPDRIVYVRGVSMLEAGMRCFVQSKLGPEVEIPDKLAKYC
jgi:hypothetical protein